MKLQKFAWHIKLQIINLSLELKDDHILNFNADCSKLAIIEIRESCILNVREGRNCFEIRKMIFFFICIIEKLFFMFKSFLEKKIKIN